MEVKGISGFNTEEQQVDSKYEWINDMVRSRHELVLSYMHLLQLDSLSDGAALDEHSDEWGQKERPSVKQITEFCDLLVDYISHGHFDLYPKLVGIIENATGRSLSIAHRALPKIDVTTEHLLQFSDRYAEDMDESKYKTLRSDLAKIGEDLETRFRNEDRLIISLRLVNTIVSSPRN